MIKDNISSIYSKLDSYKSKKKSIFLSSSFQTQSLVLLKIISDYDNTIPIYFLNTGYHFPETIHYKQQLTHLFGLNVIDLHPEVPLSQQVNSQGRFLYTSDTYRCCDINKTLPLQKVIDQYDVWVTGIRKDQTTVRETAEMFEKLVNGKMKYNPLLDWTKEDVMGFIDHYQLPRHLLDPDCNFSIGCQPCTRLVITTDERQNRWFGQTKTECGIHLSSRENT